MFPRCFYPLTKFYILFVAADLVFQRSFVMSRKVKIKMLHFENPFDDYTPEAYQTLVTNGEPSRQSKISLALDKKWNDTVQRFEGLDFNDYSVYTGTSGVALLYFKRAPDDPKNLQQIKSLLSLGRLKNRRHTFLCGDAGPLAIGAVVTHKLNESEESKTLISKLLAMHEAAVDPRSDLPSEYLYGRAGYIYALLFVNKFIRPAPVDERLIRQVIEAILTIGKSEAVRGRFKSPLMYQWHDSYYLGAAHGVAGIMYLLLHLKHLLTEQELQTLVKPTVDYLVTLKFPSGNYPSSLGSDTDGKVQWCHGAPGFVFLFSEAYKVFKDKKYLALALETGDVVWQRGLVRKGYSICHGVSGNGYCFLELYQLTNDPKHLYRAIKFAEWCVDYTKAHEEHYPDRPLSLYEGAAGPMYFLLDIQKPMQARFPGFSL